VERFSRSALLLGEEGTKKLANARVLLFGLGGVGGAVCEALARAGVGELTLVDNDTVSISNINRQLLATDETVGQFKTEAARKRILSINPACRVNTRNLFYLPGETELITKDYDYIVDAIDTVTAKLDIAEKANALGIPLISCMGTGNKLHPELLEIEDIFKTSVCPLCRVMRAELKKRGIKSLTVVYSKEEPKKVTCDEENGRHAPGSVSFVPQL
jgi:tRNA A37 threonylcarbamoyladenosine dehydratase